MDRSLSQLDRLCKSKIASFAGRGLAGQVATVKAWISGMKAGRGPNFGSSADGGFMATVRVKLGAFCVWPMAGASSNEKLEFGSCALSKVLQSLKAKESSKDSKVSLSELRPLHVFAFLLSPEDTTVMQSLTEKVLGPTNIHGPVEGEKAKEAGAKVKSKEGEKKDARNS
eukprot:3075390-Alexandrium_andersonii.AAC.1